MISLQEKLKLLPEKPGVYLHKDKSGNVIYVGKAKVLKNRVRSYFVNLSNREKRIEELVKNICDTEWIITLTESEALILENQLIKTYRPKYNVDLRDDKTYPYFKLNLREMFPRLELTRKIVKDGSYYFGPYVNVREAKATWKVIKKHFPLRQSKHKLDGKRWYRPCLNYQLGRCLGPCSGQVSQEDYLKVVHKVEQLLKGNCHELINELKEEMGNLASQMRFEEAGDVKKQIKAIEKTIEKQRVVSRDNLNRDVLYLKREAGFALVQALFIRNGILISSDSFFYKKAENFQDSELIRSVLTKLYFKPDSYLPTEVILPFKTEESEAFEEYLSNLNECKVYFTVPQRGEKKVLLQLAQDNAEQNLELMMAEIKADDLILEEVKNRLNLKKLPIRVECFDISNISGTDQVASMVVWDENKPAKKDYRKYKIKTVDGPNDFASMEEVINRRYERALTGEQPLPDLIVIDGGKGQLASAEKILAEMKIFDVDLIGLAKGRSLKRQGRQMIEEDYEYVVKPNQKNEIKLKKNSSTLHFLQNIRDEAHRFAISFHRQLRGKRAVKSSLEDIKGIGPKKRMALLKEFGSIKAIKAASFEELKNAPGISGRDSSLIINYFSSDYTDND